MSSPFVVYGLRDTYHELGEYLVKIVLSPSKFKNGHGSTVEFFDSDGTKMTSSFEVWGRKLNCKFIIDPSTSDGIFTIKLDVVENSGKHHHKMLQAWVIKPD